MPDHDPKPREWWVAYTIAEPDSVPLIYGDEKEARDVAESFTRSGTPHAVAQVREVTTSPDLDALPPLESIRSPVELVERLTGSDTDPTLAAGIIEAISVFPKRQATESVDALARRIVERVPNASSRWVTIFALRADLEKTIAAELAPLVGELERLKRHSDRAMWGVQGLVTHGPCGSGKRFKRCCLFGGKPQ